MAKTDTTDLKYEQIYVFSGPPAFEGETEHVWAEMFLFSGHFTVPTPFTSDIEQAKAEITARNPGVYVDEIDRAEDIASAMTWMRGGA